MVASGGGAGGAGGGVGVTIASSSQASTPTVSASNATPPNRNNFFMAPPLLRMINEKCARPSFHECVMTRSLTPTPGSAKEARGSEASRQGRRLFSRTPFAMRRECVVAQFNPTPGSAKEARGSGKPAARVGGFFREHLSPCDESAWWHSLTPTPGSAKEARGSGKPAARVGGFFREHLSPCDGGRAARPISRRIPSLHATSSCHETCSIGSTVPLLCPD